MASSTAPSTPEQSHSVTRRMAATRSFTVPTKLDTVSSASRANVDIGASEGVETLFVHPKANIVKFTASSGSRPSSSRQSPSPSNAQPMLPWASPTERILAAGPTEIYRVPGSVSFLHSGALLHAILPRSQCWCVDGVSKFAMRVLTDTYYRIELPGETEEELALVDLFKDCLRKVLWYERTPCPFERTFTVDLAHEPDLGVRKGQRRSDGPAKKWRLDRAYSWKPEDGIWPEQTRFSTQSSSQGSQGGSDGEPDSLLDDRSERVAAVTDEEEEDAAEQVKELSLDTPTKPKAISAAARSVTAPLQLTLRSTPPSKTNLREKIQGVADGVTHSKDIPLGTSPSRLGKDRLRTFQTIPTDMPPSPPDSSTGIDSTDTSFARVQSKIGTEESDVALSIHPIENDELHSNTLEDEPASGEKRIENPASGIEVLMTTEASHIPKNVHVKQDTQKALTLQPSVKLEEHATFTSLEPINLENNSSSSSRPASYKDDPFAAIQARIRARRTVGAAVPNRSSSPSRKTSSTSSSSSTSTRLATKTSGSSLGNERSHSNVPRNQSLATAMVQKACAMFLGPPAQLVAIMLKIAARLTNSAFGGLFIETPEHLGRRIPGSYFLEEELESETEGGALALEDWEEDDFGVPLRSPVRLAGMRSTADTARNNDLGGDSGRTSWSVD